MPPCAQTECERFTGTTEKRSTACPPSAIRIAAARPARPPPTIAMRMSLLGVAISVKDTSQQAARPDECKRRIDAHRQQKHTERDARITHHTLRPLANHDAPVNCEQPQPVRKVPDRRGDADHINGQDRVVAKLAL